MKNLKNLGKNLTSNEQKGINGGLGPINCKQVCKTAPANHVCVAPHCIYFCDGNGGFNAA